MKAEEQRIAIARAVGIKPPFTIQSTGKWTSKRVHWTIPDYLNDLNSCHEMEKVLTDEQAVTYAYLLSGQSANFRVSIDAVAMPASEFLNTLRATAAQRCEAFLRVKGLWKDS